MTRLERFKAAHDFFTREQWVLIAKAVDSFDAPVKQKDLILDKMPAVAVGVAMAGRKDN